MTTLRIRQVKSGVNHRRAQRDTLRTLGLHRIGQVVEKPDTPTVRGLVKSVHHLVTFEEIAPPEEKPRAARRRTPAKKAKKSE